jgi:hypothetical protein
MLKISAQQHTTIFGRFSFPITATPMKIQERISLSKPASANWAKVIKHLEVSAKAKEKLC